MASGKAKLQSERSIGKALTRIAALDRKLLSGDSIDDARGDPIYALVSLRQKLIESLVQLLDEFAAKDANAAIAGLVGLKEILARTTQLEQHWRVRRQEWNHLLAGSEPHARQLRLFAETADADARLVNRLA